MGFLSDWPPEFVGVDRQIMVTQTSIGRHPDGVGEGLGW